GGLTLVTHSACDGLAIGFAFQVSSAIGLVVAAAVIAHDFSDGINTANIILRNGGSRTQATYWVLADAVAPVAGIALTLLFRLPEAAFALVLSLFSGFFLYLGASDLIPESFHAHPKGMTSLATALGAVLIYTAVLFAR
ncbi:MAG: ZIP family metal transporter, partial [Alphaproteobacteria bacterium]|nr:ZIP family metal transporter [Alphaproteobacteria bacterium]